MTANRKRGTRTTYYVNVKVAQGQDKWVTPSHMHALREEIGLPGPATSR